MMWPMGLPIAIGTEPEKSGIPIIGITRNCAIRKGVMEYIAPQTMPGPGSNEPATA